MIQFLLQQRTFLTRFIYIVHLFLFLYLLFTQPLHQGRLFANLAVITFCFTLAPGIIKRLKFTPLSSLQLVLMLYRRQLGITMYLFSFYHYLLSRLLPILEFNGNLFAFTFAEIVGTLALFLLTPLFFTSNDWALKKLGKNWANLHRLVYIIVWILALHVALQSGLTLITVLILATAILEILSLIILAFNHKTMLR